MVENIGLKEENERLKRELCKNEREKSMVITELSKVLQRRDELAKEIKELNDIIVTERMNRMNPK